MKINIWTEAAPYQGTVIFTKKEQKMIKKDFYKMDIGDKSTNYILSKKNENNR